MGTKGDRKKFLSVLHIIRKPNLEPNAHPSPQPSPPLALKSRHTFSLSAASYRWSRLHFCKDLFVCLKHKLRFTF